MTRDMNNKKEELYIPHFPPQQSLYIVELEKTVGREYAPVVEDIFRMICIQFTIQLMLYFSGSTQGIFTMDLLCIIAYVVMGVLLYWLVFKSVVTFR